MKATLSPKCAMPRTKRTPSKSISSATRSNTVGYVKTVQTLSREIGSPAVSRPRSQIPARHRPCYNLRRLHSTFDECPYCLTGLSARLKVPVVEYQVLGKKKLEKAHFLALDLLPRANKGSLIALVTKFHTP